MTAVTTERTEVASPKAPRLRWWWARAAIGLWTAPLFAAAVLFCYWSGRTKEVALWGDVNWALGYSPVLLAPLAAALGALGATRSRWDHTVELFDATPTARIKRVVRMTATDWLLGCGGVLIGVLACSARPLVAGSWGSLDLLLLLTVFVGLWASMAIGYLVGWFLPHWLTVAGVAVVVYMAQGTLLGTAWQWLFPMTEQTRLFGAWPIKLNLLRILWFLAIGLTCLMLVSAARATDVTWASLPLIAAVLLASQLHGWQAGPGDEISAEVCAGTAPTVCVHPAYAPLAEQIARGAANGLRPLASSGHMPTALRQSVFSPSFDENSGVLTFNLMSVDGQVLDPRAMASMGLGVLNPPGVNPCQDLPRTAADAGARARNRVAAAIIRESQEPSKRRSSFLTSAFTKHFDKLRDCTATVADLRLS